MISNIFPKTTNAIEQILKGRRSKARSGSDAILLLRVESHEYRTGTSIVMHQTADKLAVLGSRVVATFPITSAGFRMGHLKDTVLKILERPDLVKGAILVVNNVEDFRKKIGKFLSKNIDERFVLRSIDDVFFDAGREEYERQMHRK